MLHEPQQHIRRRTPALRSEIFLRSAGSRVELHRPGPDKETSSKRTLRPGVHCGLWHVHSQVQPAPMHGGHVSNAVGLISPYSVGYARVLPFRFLKLPCLFLRSPRTPALAHCVNSCSSLRIKHSEQARRMLRVPKLWVLLETFSRIPCSTTEPTLHSPISTTIARNTCPCSEFPGLPASLSALTCPLLALAQES